jgi:hypothetical protein
MVAKGGYEYFIDRSLGKLTGKTEITVDTTNVKKIDSELLEQEYQRWVKDMGKVIEVKDDEE